MQGHSGRPKMSGHMKILLIAFLPLLSVLFPALLQAQERACKKSFKGMELYSWKNSSDEWLFALVPGTNRLKTVAEVKEHQIHGAKELERHFLMLAKEDNVFWLHLGQADFSYPDGKMMKAIIFLAEKAKINLHVPVNGV
ncbi:MAG: hypothetical protein HGB26_08440 [Desulfobulbaceae bacterium]|nr:hypothetical protein [Desulfobulbaceae bacterium]